MDYTQLAAEDLINRAYAARDEFNSLYESEDVSDNTLDRMAGLVDELEALQAEADHRVALAIKREELAQKVLGFAAKTEDAEDKADNGADEEEEGEDLSGHPVPKLLGLLRTEEKGSPKYKAAKSALAKSMSKGKVEAAVAKGPGYRDGATNVEVTSADSSKNNNKYDAPKIAAASVSTTDDTLTFQDDTPYKEDMTKERWNDVHATEVVEDQNPETKAIIKKASPYKATSPSEPNSPTYYDYSLTDTK